MTETNDIHTIERALDSLTPLAAQHLKIGREMTEAYGGAIYGMDLLAYGALNRSKAHLSGFCRLIRDRNLVCAGAVLRLQLDTALRFSAAWLVENPHAFAIAVLEGQHIRKLVAIREKDDRRVPGGDSRPGVFLGTARV